MEWPDDKDEVENDPAFQKIWQELGGDAEVRRVEKKSVNVVINQQQNVQQSNIRQQMHA